MQSIERYVLVSVLLLVAVLVAIVAWDDHPSGGAPAVTPTSVADVKGSAGRSGALDLAPVQRETHTATDRKTVPPVVPQVVPRLDELARNDARRDSQGNAPAPIIPADQLQGGADQLGPNDTSGGVPSGGAGLAGSPTATPPVVSLAPSPGALASATVPPTNVPRSGGLPTGPFVVRTQLGDQIAAEYGKEFYLWGPSGLVAAFESANPGLDPGRLSVNAELTRPPLARIEAARKTPALVPASEVASAPRREVTSELPAGGRVLDAVNLTPTVNVGGRTHTVQPGETAGQIAQLYFGRASAYPTIAAANPKVDINRIVIGQVLVIPGSADSTSSNASSTATPPANAGVPVVASNSGAPKSGATTNAPRIK